MAAPRSRCVSIGWRGDGGGAAGLIGATLLMAGLFVVPHGAQAGGSQHFPAPHTGGPSLAWRGGQGDPSWSNPRNWDAGRIPGSHDAVRFDAASGDVIVDASFPGAVGSLVLEPGYVGTVTLGRELIVQDTVVIASGTLAQAGGGLSAASWEQTGGTFVGGTASLTVSGAVSVTGGLLATPQSLMRVGSMEIHGAGIVRIGANGKLELSGDGEPLTGDGLLDTTTNRPTCVEYTGRATADIMTAKPALGFVGHGLGTSGELSSRLRQGARGSADMSIPAGAQRAFGEFGASLILNSGGENRLFASVIDATNGFAYFGTRTSPGIVVKVDLATFTRVGALTLDAGESYLGSAVIDTAGGFAYFGTSTSPGIVVKVNLTTFTRVGALTLNAGESYLSSAVIDVASGLAYFGTTTVPAMVVRVNLATLTRAGALSLNAGEDYLRSAVIDTAGGFAYFGTSTQPGIVVKVNLTTFTRVGGLTANTGEDYLTSAVIDTAHGFAYFGTWTQPGIVVKVNLTTFTRVGGLVFNSGEDYLASAVIDTASGFAYFGTSTHKGTVAKVELATFTSVGSLNQGDFEVDEVYLTTAVIDQGNGYAYFGANTYPGRVFRVNLATFSRSGSLFLGPAEDNLCSAVIDSSHGFAYFGTGTRPTFIVKVNLTTMSRVGAITLSTDEHRPFTAVIDPTSGYAYFATDTNPAKVVRIDLASFTHAGTLTFNAGENRVNFQAAVIDSANGFAYFATNTRPARVVKVDLASFARVDALAFNTGEDRATAAVIDADRGFAYFGTFTNPGRVVKVDLATFSRVDSLAFDPGEDGIGASVIDQASGFAYFGTYTGPGRVVKVNLATFTRVDSLTLGAGEDLITSAVVDPTSHLAYLGMQTYPGRVVKVGLAPFARIGVLALAPTENALLSAVIVPADGFAYFGTFTSPGIVVRIDLGNTTTSVDSSANPSFVGQGVTFTATVSPVVTGNGTPNGNVAFKSDGAVISGCSSVALDGSAKAICNTAGLSAGAHTITADYAGSGDGAWNASTGTLAGAQVVYSAVPLTVATSGTGFGTVASDPAGISCGTTCAATFAYNTTVTLSASPAIGSVFSFWTGAGCSGAGTCQVSMTQARSVTASFAVAHNLTVSRAGAGTGSVRSVPAGIACGAICNADFADGTSVTLVAIPGPGSSFAGWSGDCAATGACVATMDQAHAAVATFALVGANVWAPFGPDGGSASDLSFAPGEPTKLLAATLNGAFRSTDSGLTWSRVFGPTTAGVAFHPGSSGVALLADRSRQIYRSNDGGLTWALSNTGVAPLLLGSIGGGFRFDPSDAARIYFVRSDGAFVSTDSGASWTAIALPAGAVGQPIQNLLIEPSDPATLYLFFTRTSVGIYRSPDRGATWTPAGAGLPTTPSGGATVTPIITSALVAGSPTTLLVVASDSRVWSSTNGGTSWTARSNVVQSLSELVPAPSAAMTIYARGVDSGGASPSGRSAIYRSADGGATWSLRHTAYSAGAIAVSPTDPNVVFAAIEQGLQRSTDGGASWSPRYARMRGVESSLNGLGPMPGQPTTWFFHAGASGIFHTADDGVGFENRTANLVNPVNGAILVDPHDPNVVYSAGQVSATFTNAYFSYYARSADGGASWARGSNPDTSQRYNLQPWGLLALPTSPTTVWATAASGGLFKSSDAGASFVRTGGGLPIGLSTAGYYYESVATDTQATSMLVCMSVAGVWRSGDSGATWTDSNAGLPSGAGCRALAVSPSAMSTVYAATSQGVHKSSDGGVTWTGTANGWPVGSDGTTPQIAHAILIDPLQTSIVYASTVAVDGQVAVYRSQNAGASWSLLPTTGLDVNVIWELNLDPTDHTELRAGARGGLYSINLDLRTLSVIKVGGGTVASVPSGISCGAVCSAEFPVDELVTLNATADIGSAFTGWSGEGCSGSGTCQVTMDQARSVTATFTVMPAQTLTITKAGSGAGTVSSSPAGIDCGTTCMAAFAYNTVVTLSASPASGSAFVGWNGESCTGTGTCSVAMSLARSITATFQPATASRLYTLTPCRVFDTRESTGPTAAAPVLGTSERRAFTVTGRCGVPSAAKSIVANITVVDATAAGGLKVTGGHLADTSTSAISFPVARARANNAIIQLATDGSGTIAVTNYSPGTVHFILDVSGYFE